MNNYKPIFEIYNLNDNNKVSWIITNDVHFKFHLEELNYKFRTTYKNNIHLFDIYIEDSNLTIEEFHTLLFKYLAKRS